MKTIAVFGSSSVNPGTPEYTDAYDVGRALGQAGFAVMTGGYGGIMEATSKGASEAGGRVIGISSAPIERLRQTGVNAWVEEVVSYNTLSERLMHLVLHADGYVVMPGGVGTFVELLLAWELVRVKELPMRPLICFGTYWGDMLEPLRQKPYVAAKYWDVLLTTDSPDTLIDILRAKA